jgi:hypothetical protein
LAWRFAGAGFGDVRLAGLGGLGLGHAADRGLIPGLCVFCVITLAQASIALVVVALNGGPCQEAEGRLTCHLVSPRGAGRRRRTPDGVALESDSLSRRARAAARCHSVQSEQLAIQLPRRCR